ncbi:MAG: YCF48-related protein [Acidobacteriota bacterium]
MANAITDYEWVETNSPVASSRTDDIWFFDPHTGWLVNSNGQIAVTLDGGQNWEIKHRVTSGAYLRCIGFTPSRARGWVGAIVGQDASDPDAYLQQLLRVTLDGGETWRTVANLPKGSPGGICGLSVVNEKVAYGSGSNDPNDVGPGIVKTVDGGQSWELIDMRDYASNLIDIHFFDEQRGWVVGGLANEACQGPPPPSYNGHPQYYKVTPVALYTEDGGKTWENRVASLAFPCGEWGWKIDFLGGGDQIGFISLENFVEGAILKTLDGGKTWARLSVNDRRPLKFGQEVSNANLEGIGFIDESFGWVGGWGDRNFIGTYNSVTDDGGLTWKAEDYAVNASSQPVGDVRLNVNRYRFFGDPVNVGYCSGKKVYKLVVKGAAEAPAVTSLVAAPEAASQQEQLAVSDGTTATGHVTLDFQVPEGTQRLRVRLFNQFGFHIRSLVDETDPEAGSRSIEWDGLDAAGRPCVGPGAVICRVTTDDHAESRTFQLP